MIRYIRRRIRQWLGMDVDIASLQRKIAEVEMNLYKLRRHHLGMDTPAQEHSLKEFVFAIADYLNLKIEEEYCEDKTVEIVTKRRLKVVEKKPNKKRV
jgi:hypothetical protein